MRSLIFLVLTVAACAEQFSYEGYKVYRLYPTDEDQFQVVKNLAENEHFDLWSSPRYDSNPVDVMVKPEIQAMFDFLLNRTEFKYEILIENVEQKVKKERALQLEAPRTPQGKISFTKYHTHDEINEYLDILAYSFDHIVKVETIGKSYEGRDMKIIKVSTNPNANKPIIFIDGGIHAREWAAPAQALYIINQLVENPSNSNLLEKVDWHILPVVNPDGYEFTHTTQRFWRKTRSRGVTCDGTDANRNFDFHWGEVGASNRECDTTYMGPSAFSEIESRNVRDYVLAHKDNLKLYLTFHSYGQYILFPWGYTSEVSHDYNELYSLGEMVALTIRRVQGTIYKVGTSTNVLYPAAGGSDDWCKGVAGIELAYTIELPGGGNQGFDPPPSQIQPIVTETWEGVQAYHHYIKSKFGQSDL